MGRPSTYAPTIKVLRSRHYVQSLKDKLQPTALGLSLDAALEKLLPDLIQPEFTAKMEGDLDAIASGKQEWQAYLTGWHREYFAPALVEARQKLSAGVMEELRVQSDFLVSRTSSTSSEPSQKNRKTGNPALKSSRRSATAKGKEQKSKVKCPKCAQFLNKVPSKSKKLKANHFLKCGDPLCDTVMFWNPTKKKYELPYSQRATDPKAFTNYPCPSCGALLIRHKYKKEGKNKVMLRCSLLENRKGKCKEVAFFQSREGGFWSPRYGNLAELKR